MHHYFDKPNPLFFLSLLILGQSNRDPVKDLFINLTEPARLRRCCVSFFPKWLYTFGRDVIALSDQYPLISGFYKLLAVAIRVGDALGYFAAEVTSAERDADGDVPMSEVSC